jgi:hypothetical protein
MNNEIKICYVKNKKAIWKSNLRNGRGEGGIREFAMLNSEAQQRYQKVPSQQHSRTKILR